MSSVAPTEVGTTSTTPRKAAAPRSNRRVQFAVLAVPIVLILVLGWSKRYVEEDAFLNFRVVDQIRAGHGAVFNVGERVEVTTSTLWLGVLLVLRTVLPFVKIEYVSIVAGLVLTGLGLWWAQSGAMTLWRSQRSALFVPFGSVIYVALPPAWDRATSGLENGLSIAWLGAAMLVVARVSRRSEAATRAWPLAAAGMVLGLGTLVRPDLLLMSLAALIAVLWVVRPRGADLGRFLLGFFALPVVVEVVRAGYYGTLVPTTAIAKDSGGVHLDQGWAYLTDFVRPYWLWVPLAAIALTLVLLLRVARPRPPLAAVLALPIGGLAHALYITVIGGDYLHARLLLPSMFAIVAPIAAVPVHRRMRVPFTVVAVWAVFACCLLRPAIHGPSDSPRTSADVLDGRTLMLNITKPGHDPILATDYKLRDGLRAARLERAGKRALVAFFAPKPLLDVTPEHTTLVAPAAGINGYLAGPDVIVQEYNGLSDAVTSRLPTLPGTLAGHRKGQSLPWIVALRTTPGFTGPADPVQVQEARHALSCGALAGLLHATEDTLDAGRFASNIVGSIGRTRLVVPRNPRVAERKFCGDAR